MLAIRTAVLAILAMPTMVRLLAEADALTCLAVSNWFGPFDWTRQTKTPKIF